MKNVGAAKMYIKEIHKIPHSKPKKNKNKS